MHGNRLTHIHTSILRPAGAAGTSPEVPHIQGLDYYGRRRAGENGGDFFNFISRPASNLAVFMGGDPEPGPDSALMVSGIENLLCGLSAQAEARPAFIVEALNRSVCGPPDNSYATLFYASIDPLRHQLSYVNAGHEPALLLRKRQNRALLLESTGAILGLTHRSSYGQRTIQLEPGDLLAVFSDCVAEAVDILGRPFGPAGVLSVLRRFPCAHVADLVEEILDATERHAGPDMSSTNQTVAVVRFTGGMAEAIPAEAETQLSFAAA